MRRLSRPFALAVSLAGALGAIPAAAQSSDPNAFDLTQLRGICSYVYDKTRAAPGSGFRYEFERQLYAAAKIPADQKDRPEAAEKLRTLWRDNQDKFTCDSTNFNVIDGAITKYSLRVRSFPFVNFLISKNMDINLTDGTGETLLDYTYTEAYINQGNPALADQLRQYYAMLRRAGAKLSCELKGAAVDDAALWAQTPLRRRACDS